MKELIKITDAIHINETDVSCLELEKGYSTYHGTTQKFGTIIVMKSGRKIFAEGLTPDQVNVRLKKEVPV